MQDDSFLADRELSILARRFRGFLPVVIDVETGGFNSRTDALLEIAATTFNMDESGWLTIKATHMYHVQPFEGCNIEKAALEFTGIDPYHPFRAALPEADVIADLFKVVRREIKGAGCKRAILVGHNATFDLGFLNAVVERISIKRNPFHPFSTFDTATLAGLAYGHTVLAKACSLAGLGFDSKEAHSASYDAYKTAELFCDIVNRWKALGGWPQRQDEDSDFQS
jgi:ribonuclease T